MDIDYLLLLQNLRDGALGFLANPAAEISNFISTFWFFGVLAFFYWVYDEKEGMKFIFSFALSRWVLNMVKLVCGIYRPWIRDSRVTPLESVVSGATGYSFPSGHSVTVTALCGSFARWLWNKRRWISIALIAFIAFVMFSRNFVGVHTPQDVLVGCLIAVVFIFAAPPLLKWMNSLDLKKSTILLVCTLAGLSLLLFWFTVKDYPLDYVDGKLLVDPETMKKDGYIGFAEVYGLIFCWYINHNWLKYKVDKKYKAAILIAIVALIPLYYWDAGVKLIFTFAGPLWCAFITRFLKFVYIMLLIPFCIKKSRDKAKRLKEI